jgi:hypothetical protein
MKAWIGVWIVISAAFTTSGADLLDSLGFGKKSTTGGAQSTLTAALSQDQMIGGLKEALGKGVEQAITRLGHDGGFLTNIAVKIPMPDKLRTVEKSLRLMKQDKLADDFINTMNHAAEQAVPEAAGVFRDAITGMSIEDGKAILTGNTNAATQYFRRTTETNLFEKFLPIVKKATDATGVTAAYKKVIEKGSSATSLGSFGNSLFKADSLDVDSYVTTKTLDCLFKMIAEEEKRIRENPVARTTDLLQTVFGAIKK